MLYNMHKNQSFYSLWCHTCINDIGTLATTVAYTDTHTVQMCAHTKDVSITQSARQSSQQSDEVIVFGLSPAIYKYGHLIYMFLSNCMLGFIKTWRYSYYQQLAGAYVLNTHQWQRSWPNQVGLIDWEGNISIKSHGTVLR